MPSYQVTKKLLQQSNVLTTILLIKTNKKYKYPNFSLSQEMYNFPWLSVGSQNVNFLQAKIQVNVSQILMRNIASVLL